MVSAVALALAVFLSPSEPSITILDARVYTGNPAQPWAEAIRIDGNRIARVGSTAEIRASGAAGRTIDAGGRLLIPGINDAHAHPSVNPPGATMLDGPPVAEHEPTFDEIVARIARAVPRTPEGMWIVGEIGETVLDDPRATRQTLDPITGARPLILHAWTGHGSIYNTAALRALGVSETEPDPPGGYFGRVAGGPTLTGFAQEYANVRLRQRLTMLADVAAQTSGFQAFAKAAASFGITSVQAMMTAYPADRAAPWMAAARLPIRMRLIDFPTTAITEWRRPLTRRVSDTVEISGTKWILDGTPVERGAFLREPYADAPTTRGRLNITAGDLRAFLKRAFDAREQPMLHVTGDATLATVLDALEQTGGDAWKPLRPRIEHGDMAQPADLPRALAMGVVIVQNPAHFTIAQVIQQRYGPERAARTFLVKSIAASGVTLALGSDGPMNPFLNIMFAAMNPANPREALTVDQALSAYTRGAAMAEHKEADKGTIAPGQLADVALLSQDIFRVPLPELPKTTSVLTIMNGRIVHDALAR